jgi:regulator of protease activity HflC (stomatin/prohibitin superfamily)
MCSTPHLFGHNRSRLSTQKGIGAIGLLVTLFIVTAAFLGLIFTFGVVVPPGKIGVRQIYFDTVVGPKQGFSNKALLPGYHGNIPFLARIHLLPSTWLPIHFNAARSEKPGEFVLPPLTVKSSDGVTVHLDLTVTVRLRSAQGQDGQGGPYSLLVNVGTTPDQWVQLIRTSTNKHLVEALKGLTAEDFYNHKKRRPCEERGTEALKKSLASVGIEVGSVLLRRFAYENRQIEEAIFQKNLQQVEHVLGIMKRRLAEEKTITAKRISDIDREISVVSKNAQVRADATREQAQANLMKARVEGEALVTLSRAAIDKQRAQLLAETDGADMYVARQLTPILSSLKGGVISDINPYDLKRWVENLGVTAPLQQTRPLQPAVTRRIGSDQRREPAAISSGSSSSTLPNF